MSVGQIIVAVVIVTAVTIRVPVRMIVQLITVLIQAKIIITRLITEPVIAPGTIIIRAIIIALKRSSLLSNPPKKEWARNPFITIQ